jgi:hypothetical protein
MAASREEHHAILEGMEARDQAQTAAAVDETWHVAITTSRGICGLPSQRPTPFSYWAT